MAAFLQPRDERELSAAIVEAGRANTSLLVEGGASKSSIGRPVSDGATILSTRALGGLVFYEPAELVFRARAGTRIADIVDALDQCNQMLPFEPMDYGQVLGNERNATIGGIAATNTSGPRRIASGACRDALIGIRMVNGLGESIASGGRVMKNVTGLDLVKLVCGAWGTLGAISEVTFRVVPKPECSLSLILHGLSDAEAVTALADALGSPFSVSGAAHIPNGLRSRSATIVRLEGFASSVRYRAAALTGLWKAHGAADTVGQNESEKIWRSMRDATYLRAVENEAVWKLSVAPSKAPALVAEIQRAAMVRHFYDWGGGLVWLAIEANDNAGKDAVRAALRRAGGQATLVKAPRDVREHIAVHEPLPAAMHRLVAGIKAAFDPRGILNPGRMYASI